MTDDTHPDFFKTRRQRRPSSWQETADDMLNNANLKSWEEDFLGGFLERGYAEPTLRMKEVFFKMCDRYGYDYPSSGDDND